VELNISRGGAWTVRYSPSLRARNDAKGLSVKALADSVPASVVPTRSDWLIE
jgi:hypothetical protein